MKHVLFKNITVQFTLHDAFTTDQCIEILQKTFNNINIAFKPGGGLSVKFYYDENAIEIHKIPKD